MRYILVVVTCKKKKTGSFFHYGIFIDFDHPSFFYLSFLFNCFMVCNGIPNSGKVGRHLLFLENVKHQRVNGSTRFWCCKIDTNKEMSMKK